LPEAEELCRRLDAGRHVARVDRARPLVGRRGVPGWPSAAYASPSFICASIDSGLARIAFWNSIAASEYFFAAR
jgi:hypothetical protein